MSSKLYIANLKRKMTLREISENYGIGFTITVSYCIRSSERGKNEDIYILDVDNLTDIHRGMTIDYESFTARRQQGTGCSGKLVIKSVNTLYDGKVMSTDNIMEINENIKLPIWVRK